ncbi:MAG TPA: hypothetical protein DEA08_19350 [Planctomycetes bacterium]|nr:hypothetical protein [Planctomycetota bacterium]
MSQPVQDPGRVPWEASGPWDPVPLPPEQPLLDSNALEFEELFSEEPPEETLSGNFAGLELRGVLGRGGMATVYRAFDPAREEEVALKLIDRFMLEEERFWGRFWREARLAASLRHPRIVSVYDYGVHQSRPYLTMSLCEGPALDTLVEQEGPLQARRAATLVREVALAVHAAHEQGVLHRDLKPSNIALDVDEGPHVLDFGLAKDLRMRQESLTAKDELWGTPAYMAPEQLRAAAPDRRADVYALGATLYFLLSGRAPYDHGHTLGVIHQLLEGPPPPLEQHVAVPRDLARIVSKAMARERIDRYPTAAALAADLKRFLANAPVEATLPGIVTRAWRRLRRRPALGVALAAALTACVALPLLLSAAATRLARKQLAAQAQERAAAASEHARAARHFAAERAYSEATLLALGALRDAPHDERLRAALVEIKQARIRYAEQRGHWALANELRLDLGRLSGETPRLPATSGDALLLVEDLAPGERLELYRTDAEVAPPLEARAFEELRLAPGRYLAVHQRKGEVVERYLVTVEAGGRHVLSLDGSVAAPAGVVPLPASALFALAEARAGP